MPVGHSGCLTCSREPSYVEKQQVVLECFELAGWARHRATRATTEDIDLEERQELWECFQALTLDSKGKFCVK